MFCCLLKKKDFAGSWGFNISQPLSWLGAVPSLVSTFLEGRIHVKTQSDLVIHIQCFLVQKKSADLPFLVFRRDVHNLPQYAEAPCPSLPAGPAGLEEDKGE